MEKGNIYEHPALQGKPIDRLPRHVLIIPDGNYTYAKRNNLSRIEGHIHGMRNSIDISRALRQIDEISTVSFWVLSTKNLDQRTDEETVAIMNMVAGGLRDPEIVDDFMESGVRLMHLGSRERLSPDLASALDELAKVTKDNSRHTLALLIDYGDDFELDSIIEKSRTLSLGDTRSPKELRDVLPEYKKLPPLDLLIRSKAEVQQISGLGPIVGESVIEFIEKPWPEVTLDDILTSIGKFANIQRNFGGRPDR